MFAILIAVILAVAECKDVGALPDSNPAGIDCQYDYEVCWINCTAFGPPVPGCTATCFREYKECYGGGYDL